MGTLSLISFILMIFIIITFKGKFYEDRNFSKKIKLPLVIYLIALLISIVPIFGFVLDVFIILFLVKHLIHKNFYYKAGWIVKLLSKEM